MLEFLQLTPASFVLIIVAGFLTAVLHGATGMAGGIVMTAILSLMIGVKTAIPAMTCALIISHASRVVFNVKSADWQLALQVLVFAVPGIVAGATLFGYLSPSILAWIMAIFLLMSFPIKRFAFKQEYVIGKKTLAAGSSMWGFLAGNVVGPGFVLAPFLLTTGMNRQSFVATLASIVLVMNLVKVSVFSATELLDGRLLIIGLLIGLVSIPGNYLGRGVLRKMTDSDHRHIIDFMTLLMVINFVYLALRDSGVS